MEQSIKIKYWFFANYWWILLLAILTTSIGLLALKESSATIATVIGAELSLAYFLQKQKLEEMRLFREIFRECNSRYGELSSQLKVLARKPPAQLTEGDKGKIEEYFNLCAEEYLYYRRRYIDPSVWIAWRNGMKSYFQSQSFSALWSTEKEANSYYGLPL